MPDCDPHRDWLLNGIKNGFNILDTARAALANPVETDNYLSATAIHCRQKVEAQIKEELSNNRYAIVNNKPIIVSALGAIPKENGVRLIHDASRPADKSLNNLWDKEPFSYSTLQEATDLIHPGSFLAKCDLKNAYRCVKIHPSNFPYTGLKWTFEGEATPTYMVDTRLPFGARRSPYIFNHLSQAVCRIMKARGYGAIVAYLDDFLIISDTYDECVRTRHTLMTLLRSLGFSINYSKVEGPSQCLSFLGLTLDTRAMTVKLPEAKLLEIHQLLQALMSRPKVTKRELQRLAGKLNFATHAVYGGRFFIRRIHDVIARLRRPSHRTRVTAAMRADIQWWLDFMIQFNGTVEMLDPRPTAPIFTDACIAACGGVYGDKFVYFPWCLWPEVVPLHINFKETLAVEVAIRHFASEFRNKTIVVHCDSTAAVGIVNRGTSRDPIVMASLRRIFWLCTSLNCRLHAVHLPGIENSNADLISRLHEKPTLFKRLLPGVDLNVNRCPRHADSRGELGSSGDATARGNICKRY